MLPSLTRAICSLFLFFLLSTPPFSRLVAGGWCWWLQSLKGDEQGGQCVSGLSYYYQWPLALPL